MEPIAFRPLYMERIWGGRSLESHYGRTLPDPVRPFGESWEIVDRENEQSVADGGQFDGITLHELWTTRQQLVFGQGYEGHPRFPILVKILDARDDLSLQVHPPAETAASLGGEPKTEMWFIARCDSGARLFIGLKSGVTRAHFEQAIADGTVAGLVHSIAPAPGDSIFIPSGRLHAIGGGFLIHEIQQNSDTTFRVFDWNRAGLDGKPRDLHVRESIASIDFNDFEPTMDSPQNGILADCPHFKTERLDVPADGILPHQSPAHFSILSILDGSLTSAGGHTFGKGATLLLPVAAAPLSAPEGARLLRITLPV